MRNKGIDILRVGSMFFVVVLHNLMRGGVLSSTDLTISSQMVAWLMENLSIIAVNIFAMITGFLAFSHPVKRIRLLDVILQAVFWSIIITITLILLGYPLSKSDILLGFIPITTYWYINAYVGLVLLAPLIQAGLHAAPLKSIRNLCIILLMISVTIGLIGGFSLMSGYSAFWLIILYIVGYYLNASKISARLAPHTNWRIALWLLYLSCAIVSTVFELVAIKFKFNPVHFVSYLSPIVVIESVAFFVSLISIRKVPSSIYSITKFFVPTSFAVYVFDQSNIYRYVLGGLFSSLGKLNPLLLILSVLGVSTLMFVLFNLFDWIRIYIFSRTKLIERTYNFLSKTFHALIN